ncbi:unnamed protein product [Discula destructiva]
MASLYTTVDYLLDRANIHDTVTKLPWYYDTNSVSGLVNEVLAPQIFIDYTRILGGAPRTVDREEWATQVVRMVEQFDASQHVYGGLIIELPQPNNSSPRPDKATVLATSAGASMVRAAAQGGSLLQNGGRCIMELVRTPELEAKGVNPWRISSQVVLPAWISGNEAVMEGLNP